MTIEYPLGAGGTLTRILEAGRGDDAVIFIHGLGARADRWRRNLGVFAEAGYHCFALDLPGHGFAGKTTAFPYGVPGFADFVGAIMDKLGLGRVHMVGTSLGGHIAGWIACHAPERVRSLVLVGSLGLVPIGAEAGDNIHRNVKATDRPDIENKLKFVLYDPSIITPEWIEEEYRINNSPGAADSFARLGDYIAEEVDQHNVGENLAEVSGGVPVMLVWGRQDKAVPLSVGEQGKALLGDANLLVIDEAGHAPYFEQAEQFNGAVLKFLGAQA